MNFIQTILQALEVGKGQIIARIVPLLTILVLVGGAYDMVVYHGLNDAQSMDNAQLARQIVRQQGFTTEFLRPQAVAQLRDYAASRSVNGEKTHPLFPPDQFPAGTPRVLPDTYNAPGYPYILAAYFYFIHPTFNQSGTAIMAARIYSGEKWIPLLNQGFMLLTAIMVFALGRRLFDDRVAWISLVAFLATDLVWKFSVTALSTNALMFFVTVLLMCCLEVFCVGEECIKDEDRSFGPAWLWAFIAALLLGAACLTRLHLLVLLIPLFVFLQMMPRRNFLLFFLIALMVTGLTVPWFIHVNAISGNPLGSNFALLLYGEGIYTGNQIYCGDTIPSYELLFREAGKKELEGFLWHFEHGWNLLGSNPFILLFGVSILHQFRRHRTRWFHWLLFACALVIVAANSLGSAKPDNVDQWNTVVVLFPCMLVMGAAYFFVLLDRLHIQIRLLTNVIVISMLVLTALPLTRTLVEDKGIAFNYPPYIPPLLKVYGQYAQPDEWVTSDMPWATAWYADRASLWLPDSIDNFKKLNKDVCPTGILILSPIAYGEPISTFKSGEYKDWLSFIMGDPAPPNFPLVDHVSLANIPDYIFWSDRPRWAEGK